MEKAIRELEEQRSCYHEQLRKIKRELRKVDQALARLRGHDQPIPPPECKEPEPGTRISARTPWP